MDRLRQYCEERLLVAYPLEEHAWANLRLHQELKAIQTYGQWQAFEDAQRSVQRVKDQGGHARLIGAGCSSLVSYLLGLSEIDPIPHGLLFERFLETNSLRTIQFQFVANWMTGHGEADHQPLHDGFSNRAVCIQQATPFEAMPGLVADEIRRNDHSFDLNSIRSDDEDAYAALRFSNIGFSQFESLDARLLLSDFGPKCLTQIAAIKAILVAENDEPRILDEFIRRGVTKNRQVSEEWSVQTTLDETRGMILFQEQIMLIINRVADIPLADAYAFIKGVCKRHWDQVATYREWFVVSAVGNGMNEQQATTLFETIRDSATRAVCKAHHLSEALVAYQTAFLQAHFPREFDRALQVIRQ